MINQNEMIFGIRAVIEAIEAGKEIDKILIKKDLSSDLSRELFAVLRDYDVPVQRVPMEKLNRLSRKNHQGVIAFTAAVTYHRIADIIPQLYEEGKTPFIVVLDGVTDVRNFGAIARTCECAGVDAIVIPVRGGAAVNADAVKTSAGALHTIPVCREHHLLETVKFLKNSGIQIVAASEKAAQSYTAVDYSVPVAIVMGAEDVGISPDIIRISDHLVSIPIRGTIQSLNVSVATGVLVYEAVKYRI
jgi:23S rRNA (guanosine2251-2'-O)-methyltransferase